MMRHMTTTMRRFILSAAKYTGLFLWAQRLTRNSLRLVYYQGLVESGKSGARPGLPMRPATFEARMGLLDRLHYPVLGLEEAAGCLERGDLPGHATVIMFDQQSENAGPDALAVLRHYHFPAAFGISPDQTDLAASGKNQAANAFGAKKSTASNPGFNSGQTTCYKFILVLDREDVHAIEFEAELVGFLETWRGFRKKF